MIKVGIVGAGFMGKMHAQVYQALPNTELVAVADADKAKANELAGAEKVRLYSRPETLIRDKDVQVVDICLPTYLHKKYVLKAAKKGKHILCEKPISNKRSDARKMIAAAKEARVKFMVAHCIRFWPEYMRLTEIFRSGELGQLKHLVCRRLSPTPVWSWENWLMVEKYSGGALMDLHVHDTDFIVYLLGKPNCVYARGLKTEGRGYDHVFTTFSFANGVTAVAEGGWDMPGSYPFTTAFRALFEKGVVEYNSRLDKPMIVYRAGGEPEDVRIEPLASSADAGGNITNLGGYYNEIEYFINCIENDKPITTVTPEEALQSLEMVLLEKKSIETGRKIKVK